MASLRDSFRRVITLTMKESWVVMLDKKTRFQLFLPPLVMLFVFSFAITMEVKNASLAVLNRDSGDLGRQFVSYFSSGPTFTRVFELKSVQEIRPTLENQQALLVLHIPEDFSAKLLLGHPISVQTLLDGRKVNAAQIANGYANTIAQRFEWDLRFEWGLIKEPLSSGPPLEVLTRYWFNPNQSFLWFNLPVLLVLLTQMIALIVSGMSVARERELGTFEQLLVSPLSSVEIVIGKASPAVFLAFCEGIVIHGIARTVFGVPFTGSLLLLAFSLWLFILSVTGVGLFISSICDTQQQAFLGCFAYMVPAVLLSGFVAPIENMPRFLQLLTLLNPARHIIRTSLGIYLKDLSLSAILEEILWLGGIAGVTLLFAAWFFKKKTR
ncbi:MAG: ABC transporter permease [Synergistaceae bacterium]|jgi:ABC-2 type transport system permease protein|nr:ABC transporter permease [Synergistaceae bacterium]